MELCSIHYLKMESVGHKSWLSTWTGWAMRPLIWEETNSGVAEVLSSGGQSDPRTSISHTLRKSDLSERMTKSHCWKTPRTKCHAVCYKLHSRHRRWLDQTKLKISGLNWKLYMWKKGNSAHDTEHTMSTVRHGGGSIIRWGCSVRDDGNMNAAEYRTGRKRVRSFKRQDVGRALPFRRTTTWVTMDWVRSLHISLLEWSGQSLNLNPTGNLW